MKNIYLLGATGSIGSQTLEVLRSLGEDYRLVSISFGKNIESARKIIDEFHPLYVCSHDEETILLLKKVYSNIEYGYGNAGLIKAAIYNHNLEGENIVINAVVGMVGLVPTIEAIKMQRTILLANKETLVVGGEIITKLVKEYNTKLIPIDSEHSAIMQCLENRPIEEVNKIIITASGGAFRDKTREELESVTLEDALKHPNWQMGAKITIDSATMVNKGLEVIEAHFLFNIPYDKITTVIHKNSIVHSLVEYIDNTIIAQICQADMRIPIQYALTYPNRLNIGLSKSLDITSSLNISFQKMDLYRFPCLQLAYEVGVMGGVMPAVYNASNEEAVSLFINKKIKFLEIEEIIFNTVRSHPNIINPSLEEILMVDKKVRNKIKLQYQNRKEII